MINYIIRRLMLVPLLLFGVTILIFGMLSFLQPVERLALYMRDFPKNDKVVPALIAKYDLDKPIFVQYWNWLVGKVDASGTREGGILFGNFGYSRSASQPVVDLIMRRFPATLELSLCALLFASVLGLLAGVLAAIKRGSILDHGVMGLSLTGFSMPIFWWGLLLIMFASVSMREWAPAWALPVSGRLALEYDIPARTGFMLIDTWLSGEAGAFKSALRHLVLPAIVLGTVPLAVIARMTRSSMLEVLREDYVRTARAKGLSPARVVFVHALRNALVPVVTVMGLLTGTLLGGAVLTETIFSWPGIGKWLIDAISRRDYPVVQGGILIVATLVIGVNLLVDLLYGLINPRIRHAK